MVIEKPQGFFLHFQYQNLIAMQEDGAAFPGNIRIVIQQYLYIRKGKRYSLLLALIIADHKQRFIASAVVCHQVMLFSEGGFQSAVYDCFLIARIFAQPDQFLVIMENGIRIFQLGGGIDG